LTQLAIEHYFPHHTEGLDHPLFIVEEHLRAGMVQNEFPEIIAGYYDTHEC
jgi:hypothetical protein